MKFTLQRVYKGDDCTLGIIYDAMRAPLIFTLEKPWKENKKGISCIPTGVYKCVPHNGSKFKDVWRLEDVAGRTAILIHAGNTVDDIQGCILTGKYFDKLKGKKAVMSSQVALNQLKVFVGRGGDKVLKSFELEIIEL